MAKTLQWAVKDLPDFSGLKVFTLPGPGYGLINSLFCKAGAKKAHGLYEANLVVFLGGTDVNPALYGEKPIQAVKSIDIERDRREKEIFEICSENNISMLGICRGAQFLHVMNGGKLWQHVDGHAGPNHLIYDIDEDVTVLSSSTHHQMMRHNDQMNVIAVTQDFIASFVQNEEEVLDTDDENILEVEACFYQETKCLCIQGHPEYGPPLFTSWSFHKLHDLLICDWDVFSTDKVLKTLV